MLRMLCLLSFGALLVLQTDAARILAIVSAPSYSHQKVYRPLWKELLLRGHHVTLLTTDPLDDQSLKNLTEIDLSNSYEILNAVLKNMIYNQNNILEGLFIAFNIVLTIADHQMEQPEVQKIIRNESERFDLVISEVYVFPLLAFGQRFNCPVIGINSGQINVMSIRKIGNPAHPLLFQEFSNPYDEKMNFIERFYTVLARAVTDVMFEYHIIPRADKIAKKHFGDRCMPMDIILKNVNLIFVTTDFIFQAPKPLLPTVIQIGGELHISPSKPLPKDLQQLLDTSKNGFIYFSLGGNVRSSDLPNATLKIISDVFSELPYTILWKFEQEELPGKPDNVFISKWFPQQDVLAHPNIKLFISHDGQQSLDEAIHFHVPIVGIPFFVDQPGNIKRLVSRGCALFIDFKTMERGTLKDAILEVAHNPKYRKRITELAELLKDQPMSGLEKAVWWTEYVIRHKGATHLRSPAIDVPWYQYYLLDVLSFCFALSTITLYLLAKIAKLVFRLMKYAANKLKPKIKIH